MDQCVRVQTGEGCHGPRPAGSDVVGRVTRVMPEPIVSLEQRLRRWTQTVTGIDLLPAAEFRGDFTEP